MSGGKSTHAGIAFQDSVAAWVAAHVLAEQDAPAPWGLAAGVLLEEVRLETEEPVDDVFARASNDGICVINAKTKVDLSDNPKSALASVIDQFVRQWLAGVPDGDAAGSYRPVDVARDRMILAVSSESSERLRSDLSAVVEMIIDLGSPNFEVMPKSEIEVYEKICSLISNSWLRHRGVKPTNKEIDALLSGVRIQAFSFDEDGAERNLAHAYIRNAVVAKTDDAAAAWEVLCSACTDFGKRRSGAGRTRLRNILREKGFLLRNAPSYAEDIGNIIEYSKATSESLSHLAELVVPGEGEVENIVVPRACVDALCDSASEASVLVIGAPGAGKSGALHQAAMQLVDNGHSVIQLAVDQLPLQTLGDLDAELGINHRFLNVLQNWETEKPGYVFIDALDATRGGSAEPVFRNLIRQIVREIPNWNVVASIRTFDLRYSRELQSLFRGTPAAADYLDAEFGNISHIKIPSFSEQELSMVWEYSPQLGEIYKRGEGDLRELIRIPFNLFLLAEVLLAGHDAEGLTGVATRAELLDLYWDFRIADQGRQRHERENLLLNIIELMITDRALVVGRRDIDTSFAEPLEHLLSRNVLSEIPSRAGRINPERLTFGHHVVFDYSVARLVLQNGCARDFVERLTVSEDSALMLAPAALMAFRQLWLEDPEKHIQFWEMAFRLVADENTNAICRMLAPRAAVEWIETENDVAPVFLALEDRNKVDAATFLFKHLYGAIVADVLPNDCVVGANARAWTAIVRKSADFESQEMSYLCRAIVANLTSDPNLLTVTQLVDLNTAARAILDRALDAVQYDSNIVRPSIEAVATTIAADVDESVQILRRLIEHDHFAQHADEELHSLTWQFDALCEFAPDFLAEIYSVVFRNKAPSQDEVTHMGGSRILPLSSNRRQDYEMIRYQLAEKFTDFVEKHPVTATKALIATVEGHVAEKETTDRPIQPLQIGDIGASFQADACYAWWNPEEGDRTHDDAVKILNRFVSAMQALVQAGIRDSDIAGVIQTILQTNRQASVWAALIRIATFQPKRVGLGIVDVLTQETILDSYETREPAGQLLTNLHPLLDNDQKSEIEKAILGLANEQSRNILIGCLSNSELALEESRNLLSRLRELDEIPANSPPFRFSTRWGESDDDWWLKEEGVDLDLEPNRSVKAIIDEVEALTPPDGEKIDKHSYLAKNWAVIEALADSLRAHREIPKALSLQGWDCLAEVCGTAAENSETSNDIDALSGIDDMTLEALHHDDQKAAQEAEERFERTPSWGRPAPRIVAARTIMLLVRAKARPDSVLDEVIRSLVKDPIPAVRNQIASHINVISIADPELMWSLCEYIFKHESNRGVLRLFLRAFSKVMWGRLDWATDCLITLIYQYSVDNDEPALELRDDLAILISRLWIRQEQAAAGLCIESWLSNVVQYESEIARATADLRDAITLGDVNSSSEKENLIRARVVAFLERVATAAAPIYVERATHWDEISDSDRLEAETALKLLDGIATQIYFGSKAYDAKNNKRDLPTKEARIRFLAEMGPTLRTLCTVQYPSVTHHLLETLEYFVPDDPGQVFDLITTAMLRGGAEGGYQQESLGTNLFVKLIERYLADHRYVLMDEPARRNALIRCLNFFVEAGWPEARRLVYDLPAMLR